MWLVCLLPLLWSLSFLMVFRVALIRKMLNRGLFLSPKKRAHGSTSTQEEIRYESSHVKAQPFRLATAFRLC